MEMAGVEPEAGRLCYANGLMHGSNGNISMRLGNDRVVITPSKLCKGRLEPDDLMIIDMEGMILKADATRNRKYSSEAPIHLEIYRQRSNIRAVIHAHPEYATALTVADVPFPVNILPDVMEDLGPVPTTRFAKPTPMDSVAAIQEFVMDHNAILIRNHGAICYGADLEEALNRMELVESVARTVITAHRIGKIHPLPEEIMIALRAIYEQKRY